MAYCCWGRLCQQHLDSTYLFIYFLNSYDKSKSRRANSSIPSARQLPNQSDRQRLRFPRVSAVQVRFHHAAGLWVTLMPRNKSKCNKCERTARPHAETTHGCDGSPFTAITKFDDSAKVSHGPLPHSPSSLAHSLSLESRRRRSAFPSFHFMLLW